MRIMSMHYTIHSPQDGVYLKQPNGEYFTACSGEIANDMYTRIRNTRKLLNPLGLLPPYWQVRAIVHIRAPDGRNVLCSNGDAHAPTLQHPPINPHLICPRCLQAKGELP